MPDGLAREIADAAAAIVDAFRANDEERYFAGFAPECSFAFHTDAEIHLSRDEWRDGWRELVSGGWRVVDCRSLETHVQTVGEDGGVFLHELETTAEQDGAQETYRERETIVFERRDGKLLAIHEHLSPVPAAAEAVAEVGGADAADEVESASTVEAA